MSLHGISELTWDTQGYIYWKGKRVEHYNQPTDPSMAKPAANLKERCQHLETIEVPISISTVVWCWDWFKGLTKEHPYKTFITRLSFAYEHPNGQIVITAHDKKLGRYAVLWDGQQWQKFRRFGITSETEGNEDVFDYRPLSQKGFLIPDMGQRRIQRNDRKMPTPDTFIYVSTAQLVSYLETRHAGPSLLNDLPKTAPLAKLVKIVS